MRQAESKNNPENHENHHEFDCETFGNITEADDALVHLSQIVKCGCELIRLTRSPPNYIKVKSEK